MAKYYEGTQVSLLQNLKQIHEQARMLRKMRHSLTVFLTYCDTPKERKEVEAELEKTKFKLEELDRALPLAEKRERENKTEREKVCAEVKTQKEEAKKEAKPEKKKRGLLDMLDLD